MGDPKVKQWQTLQDGLEGLSRTTVPMPKPGKDEVLVKINTVSLNYRDTGVVTGLYNDGKLYNHDKLLRPDPLVPCSDMCGTVVALGDDDRDDTSAPSVRWRVGDRVLSTFAQSHLTGQLRATNVDSGLGKPLQGVLQTYRVFPATGLVAAPAYLSDQEACCLPIAAVTAWMALNAFQPLGQPADGRGRTVLLQGTGGVSISGLQIAKASGATTIVTSSSDVKLQRAASLGADHLINYHTNPEWQEEVLTITGGRGADVVLDCAGPQTLRRSLEAVAFGGLVSCVGYVTGTTERDAEAGPVASISLLTIRRNTTLHGVFNGPRDRFEELCAFYAEHRIRPPVDRVFPFSEAKEALEYLASGAHFGKVVVQVIS